MNQIVKISTSELSRITGEDKRDIRKEASRYGSSFEITNGNGGHTKEYFIKGLPAKYQVAVVKNMNIAALDLTGLCADAALAALRKLSPDDVKLTPFFKPAEIQEGTAWNKDIALKERIAQEYRACPLNVGKTEWAEHVALKYGVSRASVYRYEDKLRNEGLPGLKHGNSRKGKTRVWTPGALEFWIGLRLKREHRKISSKALYRYLRSEAERRGWKIGSLKNALWQLRENVTPQLLALRDGGSQAFDNMFPPIPRNYSDLAPFVLLCGDQHRFDFWVVDEETGETFRPECYLWQDLRTRLIYGGALAKKYNSQLMGLALRVGVKFFGLFQGLYTDNGRPEQSIYIQGIQEEIKKDFGSDSGFAGTHTFANAYNAKAKVIENTNLNVERIIRDEFLVPGYVKSLKDSTENQKIDEVERKRLTESGRLLTFREFVIVFYNALAFFNNDKAHRGVLREWKWLPKPVSVTPMDCLKACQEHEGWRPVMLSDDAIDLLFLSREDKPRIVDHGRITFNNEIYGHDKLIPLHGQKVFLRYDPFDPEWILVFRDDQYLCRASLVTYSSMKDKTLAESKIVEKARLRKEFLTHYRSLTSRIPDIRFTSNTPQIERIAAQVANDRAEKINEDKDIYRMRKDEELKAEIAEIENYANKPKALFSNAFDRFQSCIDRQVMGEELPDEDRIFYNNYFENLNEGDKEYWKLYENSVKPATGEKYNAMDFCS